MKTTKSILFMIAILLAMRVAAQSTDYIQRMESTVTRLDQAARVSDYQVLANDFIRIGEAQKDQWLPYYYAAYCNAKIGYLYGEQDKSDKIEPFSNLAETQIEKARSLLKPDNKKEMSEVYCVISMVNRTRVFINPMTNGRKFGPIAGQYIEKARSTDPDNPRVIVLDAWVKCKTPKLWGGDKEKAKALAEEALKKLEVKPASSIAPRWGRKDCETIIQESN